MRRHEEITDRGRGTWGQAEYQVALVAFSTTWTEAEGDRTETRTGFGLRCSEPVGARYFDSKDERERFINESFSQLALDHLDPPERRTPEPDLAAILGEELSSVEFVRDYLQLRFDSPPLNLYTWPSVHRPAGEVLDRGAKGYLEAIVELIGRRVLSSDEFLDLGLVLDFEGGTQLAVPLSKSLEGVAEAVDFHGEPGRIWIAGEDPFTDSDA